MSANKDKCREIKRKMSILLLLLLLLLEMHKSSHFRFFSINCSTKSDIHIFHVHIIAGSECFMVCVAFFGIFRFGNEYLPRCNDCKRSSANIVAADKICTLHTISYAR